MTRYRQPRPVGPAPSPRIGPGPPRHITAGHPLPGVRVVVLDDTGMPVADGEPGIVWIGGERLARGYVGRAVGAQGRFSTLPDGEPGYRTGDVGRIDDHGRLVLLGREDRRADGGGPLAAPRAGGGPPAPHPPGAPAGGRPCPLNTPPTPRTSHSPARPPFL